MGANTLGCIFLHKVGGEQWRGSLGGINSGVAAKRVC